MHQNNIPMTLWKTECVWLQTVIVDHNWEIELLVHFQDNNDIEGRVHSILQSL